MRQSPLKPNSTYETDIGLCHIKQFLKPQAIIDAAVNSAKRITTQMYIKIKAERRNPSVRYHM